ncbi:putative talin [Monocercomonoides exilis]|uniref:putative talin n=1 Tax=Monocercomonoides exilis TaxID=2049356 RepID=UPI003559799C|nr:putative talin [Monocercomonoides exilis]|eukprot:MONOS_795.1-p1 / transcript=MONOS_795.1 / gene=MONOS_795 / organism=Monocercomonoides_exilis_PA203 / gene_product=unspecified product / transcript_product=unspecified product / location=Mono_scaffold00013:144526-145669(-) / protein_length=315 / sequence_SO=supercontig / SO=protein_coding / is_pseudo=false
MIDVYYEDGSSNKFITLSETKVEDLLQKIAIKISLTVEKEAFSLFESSAQIGVQQDHLLTPNEIVPTPTQFTKLLFKRRNYFSLNLVDPIAVHMTFIQLREDVLRGHYVLDQTDFLRLAALDMQITFGNPSASGRKAGFLTSANLIPRFLPKWAIPVKKEVVWEKLILDEYQRLIEKPIAREFEGKVRYIEALRSMASEQFGCVYFEGSDVTLPKSPHPAILGVNKEGIFLYWIAGDEKEKKSQPNILVRSNAFSQIIGWAAHVSSSTFVYSLPGPEDGTSVDFSFESPLFAEIPSFCQEVVDFVLKAADHNSAS